MQFTEVVQEILVALPPEPVAARRARRALDDARLPDEFAHTVGLLATELIANALRHGNLGPDDRITLAASFVSDFVHVEVHDPGAGFDPESRHHVKGYGLRMVDKLSSRWGVECSESGHRVWFEIDKRRRRFDRDRD